jgi:hypothetical protein
MRELFSKTVEANKGAERGWLKWVALSGFWTFIALLYGNQTYFFMRALEYLDGADAFDSLGGPPLSHRKG